MKNSNSRFLTCIIFLAAFAAAVLGIRNGGSLLGKYCADLACGTLEFPFSFCDGSNENSTYNLYNDNHARIRYSGAVTRSYRSENAVIATESKLTYIGDAESALALGLTEDYVGFYAVGDADGLFAFAELVSHDPSVCAVLLSDIVLNEGLFTEKLTLDPVTLEPSVKAGLNVREWTPIIDFCGTLDGRDHAVKGLFVKGETSSVGFISLVEDDGTVKNLKLTETCVYSSSGKVGTVAGENHGRIISCSVSSSIAASLSDYVGGLAGTNSGKITTSSFCGKVTASCYAGGIAGENSGEIEASFVLSSDGDFINAVRYAGGICGKSSGIISYSYSTAYVSANLDAHLAVGCAEYGSSLLSVFSVGDSTSDSEIEGIVIDEVDLKSGEICCLLNEGGERFYQTVGQGYPMHSGERVYRNYTYTCPGDFDGVPFYSNVCGNVIENPNHLYSSDCDEKCNLCDRERKAPALHTFVDNCDDLCDLCGQMRIAPHNYDNACDDTCNDCGTTRDASHKYSGDCDFDCDVCGFLREAAPHSFSYPCDPVCNDCGYVRTNLEHTYDNACDGDCNYCGKTRLPPHVFTSDCDEECNLCDGRRTAPIEHIYDAPCDSECNLCGHQRTSGEHSYTDACDGECDECGEPRTPPHVFDSECDEECNLCGSRREASAEHIYDASCDAVCNACAYERVAAEHAFSYPCDAVCNECGYTRIPSEHTYSDGCYGACVYCGTKRAEPTHKYDSACDAECNICGEIREISGHDFGDWRVALEPTLTETGIKIRTCTICGKTESDTLSARIFETEYTVVFALCSVAVLAVSVSVILLIAGKIKSRRLYSRYYR